MKKPIEEIKQEMLKAITAQGGEVVDWQSVTDSEGDIHIIPRVRISRENLAKFEKERK